MSAQCEVCKRPSGRGEGRCERECAIDTVNGYTGVVECLEFALATACHDIEGLQAAALLQGQKIARIGRLLHEDSIIVRCKACGFGLADATTRPADCSCQALRTRIRACLAEARRA